MGQAEPFGGMCCQLDSTVITADDAGKGSQPVLFEYCRQGGIMLIQVDVQALVDFGCQRMFTSGPNQHLQAHLHSCG